MKTWNYFDAIQGKISSNSFELLKILVFAKRMMFCQNW